MMLRKATVIAASLLGVAVVVATPASADPDDNPCEFAANYFCQFIPIAPDLEGDVDLTQQQHVDPNAPPPESLPVVDPCAAGCI